MCLSYDTLYGLFPLCIKKNIEVRERPLNKHSLDSTDVFILDLGEKIYQVGGVNRSGYDRHCYCTLLVERYRCQQGREDEGC